MEQSFDRHETAKTEVPSDFRVTAGVAKLPPEVVCMQETQRTMGSMQVWQDKDRFICSKTPRTEHGLHLSDIICRGT
jgi:hypothetical protein